MSRASDRFIRRIWIAPKPICWPVGPTPTPCLPPPPGAFRPAWLVADMDRPGTPRAVAGAHRARAGAAGQGQPVRDPAPDLAVSPLPALARGVAKIGACEKGGMEWWSNGVMPHPANPLLHPSITPPLRHSISALSLWLLHPRAFCRKY